MGGSFKRHHYTDNRYGRSVTVDDDVAMRNGARSVRTDGHQVAEATECWHFVLRGWKTETATAEQESVNRYVWFLRTLRLADLFR